MSQAPTKETSTATVLDIDAAVESILGVIDQEREREIVTRRFGLYDRKETLEQIGELLGITRERVRQLEKAIINRLKNSATSLPQLSDIEAEFIAQLEQMGSVAKVDALSGKVASNDNKRDH